MGDDAFRGRNSKYKPERFLPIGVNRKENFIVYVIGSDIL